MNYKKYTNNAYNLHLITTDKFKSVLVKINFKHKLKKEDITYRNLLTKILLQSTAEYPNKRLLEIASEELYNLSVSASNSLSGNYIITSFSSYFLNEKYTEENMNEQSLLFILDLLFNPNVKNKKFENFELVKRLVQDEITTMGDNTKNYSQIRLLEEIDKKSPLAFNSIGYLEDLEKIDSQKLYHYYESLLKSDLIDIFVIGNIKADEFKQIITNNFNINTIKKTSESHFIKHHQIRKRAKIIKEQKPIKQAKLSIGFKTDSLTDFEIKYVGSIYSFILGGGPDSKLFKNVREKHSLCYNISCIYRPVINLMAINAGIDSKDFKKCINLIKKEISKITKGDFDNNDIESAKITYINSLEEIEDNPMDIIKTFEAHEYLGSDLLDERKKCILNVTKDDVIKLSKKIHLDTVFFLEGGSNESN